MRLALGVALVLFAVAVSAGYVTVGTLRAAPGGSSWVGGPAVIVTPISTPTPEPSFVPVFTPLPATAAPAAAAVAAGQAAPAVPVATPAPVVARPVPIMPAPAPRRRHRD